MHIEDLDYEYSDHLIATEPVWPCRVMLGDGPDEISFSALLDLFKPNDILIINDTRVEARRVFSKENLEILFLKPMDALEWEVLFPAKSVKDGQSLALPGGVTAKLVKRGLPQTLQVSQELTSQYFAQYGEVALPPYIQKARGARHNRKEDSSWYQTEWAQVDGSVASPTASLHFRQPDLENLKTRGVAVSTVTLHVGIGTFLPIRTENVLQHQMHAEVAVLPAATLNAIEKAKSSGGRVWALGTTVARTLESFAAGKLQKTDTGDFAGSTDLFIYPGFKWNLVDALLTNFHQPRTTLIALVASFAGDLQKLKAAYKWAVDRNFRLFSYGDLTVWFRK